MAKDLRSRMVLDISDLRNSLSQAERETRKTVAAIERDSKTSITAIRGGLLGGLGAGNSVSELKAYQRESMGIGGGADARYNGLFGQTQRKSSDYGMILAGGSGVTGALAKAAPYVAAVSLGINAANVAVDIFQGKWDDALKTAQQIPIVGSAIIKPVVEISTKLGWIKKDTQDAALSMETYAARAKIAADFTAKIGSIRDAANADSRGIGASDVQKDEVALADIRKAALLAIDKELIESTRKLREERNKVTADRERSDPQARAADALFQKERKRMQDQAAEAKKAVEDNYWLQYMEANKKDSREEGDRRANIAKAREDERMKEAEARKEKERTAQADLETRTAAMMEIARSREGEYFERQRQSRYDPYGGNAALQSQTLTRVPGSGNKATVEDPKMIAVAERTERILQRIERLQERNQLAVAEL